MMGRKYRPFCAVEMAVKNEGKDKNKKVFALCYHNF